MGGDQLGGWRAACEWLPAPDGLADCGRQNEQEITKNLKFWKIFWNLKILFFKKMSNFFYNIFYLWCGTHFLFTGTWWNWAELSSNVNALLAILLSNPTGLKTTFQRRLQLGYANTIVMIILSRLAGFKLIIIDLTGWQAPRQMVMNTLRNQ